MAVKSITYNYSYSKEGSSRFLVCFEKENIRYTKEPLEEGTKFNPKVEVSYNPTKKCTAVSFANENGYANGFTQLCELVETMVDEKFPKQDVKENIEASSLVITFEDNKEVIIDGLMEQLCKIFENFSFKYMPSDFGVLFKGEYDLNELLHD